MSSGRECPVCRQHHLSNNVLGYLSRTRTLNLNPNPITDPNTNPNPKINKKQNDTGMKLNIELYLKVDFVGTGVGL